jgi:hypothetical protein
MHPVQPLLNKDFIFVVPNQTDNKYSYTAVVFSKTAMIFFRILNVSFMMFAKFYYLICLPVLYSNIVVNDTYFFCKSLSGDRRLYV